MLDTKKGIYEEEVSLYDILQIIGKYKKKMTLIIMVGIIITLAAALIVRNFREEDSFQDFRLHYSTLENDFYYQLIGLNYVKFDTSDILQVEKYINRFLEIPELKALYEKEKEKDDRIELYKKRKFINEVIQVGDSDGYGRLQVILDSDIDIAPQIMDIYFSILQEEIPDKIKGILVQTKERALVTNANAVTNLNIIKEKLANVINIGGFKANNREDLDFLVSLKYPLLISDKDLYQSIYAKTEREIVGIDIILREGKIDQIIEKRGSMVIGESKSKAMSILLIGSFLSILLAFLFVIVSECKNSYKKYEDNKGLLENK